jgi:hypothetical protein
MKIARERYLDDSTRWFLTLELWTRTAEMHSAMDALSPEQRQAMGDAIVDALDRIARIVEPVAIERGARPVRVAMRES